MINAKDFIVQSAIELVDAIEADDAERRAASIVNLAYLITKYKDSLHSAEEEAQRLKERLNRACIYIATLEAWQHHTAEDVAAWIDKAIDSEPSS
jgi:hypothetical protein